MSQRRVRKRRVQVRHSRHTGAGADDGPQADPGREEGACPPSAHHGALRPDILAPTLPATSPQPPRNPPATAEALATPQQILIDASNGASDYGNKFGEPLIAGYTRTYGQRLANGERREWIKPIMFRWGCGFGGLGVWGFRGVSGGGG